MDDNKLSQSVNDTIVAIATAHGTGAIGVIRLSGDDAIRITDKVFRGAKKLELQPSHTIHYGYIYDEQDNVVDEVMVALFKAPRSYTKENIIEISCHGSPYILQELIQLFVRNGARMANAGEFTMRAFLNGRIDLAQAEAVSDLIQSESKAAQQLALSQMKGGISNEIKQLREQLIHFVSLIELELDFGEEDVEFADRSQLSSLLIKAKDRISQLLHSFKLGNALKNGINTVIAGRPNAGKSTLLNVLVDEERAIVSDIPGTTRDVIEEVINIEGLRFRLMDTAGLRDAQDEIEKIGIERTLGKIQQSTLLLYIFDASQLSPKEVKLDLERLYLPHLNVILVANKLDLNPSIDIDTYASTNISSKQIISTSALMRKNTEQLKKLLYELASDHQMSSEATIVINARHYEALSNAKTSLEAAEEGLRNGVTTDFVAMDIRRCLFHLGEVVGTISTDDLLDKIFRDFCIGK